MNQKPIPRRRRIKQTLSFNERLQIFAERTRQQALENPAGALRNRMLTKARLAENVANVVKDQDKAT